MPLSHATPPLIEAVLRNDAAEVARLLAAGADPNTCTPVGGATAVMVAASSFGKTAIVQLLLDAGADPNRPHSKGFTALQCASAFGIIENVRCLLQAGANPNAGAPNYAPTLVMAAGAGHADVVAALLDGGADPNTKNDDQVTALLAAAEKGHAAVVRLLLAAGADPTPTMKSYPNEHLSALQIAVKNEHTTVVHELVRGGALAQESVCPLQTTALIEATRHGNICLLPLLLEAGADPLQKTLLGKTAVDVVFTKDDNDHAAALLVSALRDRLNEPYGNSAGTVGEMMLVAAAGAGFSRTLSDLIQMGVSLDCCDKAGTTAVMHAVEKKQWGIVDLLLEEGVDVHRTSADGISLLFLVALRAGSDQEDLVQRLLQRGADPTQTTPGRTPASVASNKQVRKLLERAQQAAHDRALLQDAADEREAAVRAPRAL